MPELKIRKRSDGTIALMGHVIADFPSPSDVRAMIAAMAAAGAEVIEIQIPFSEPMADGPRFLAANHAALARGVDYPASLALMSEVTAKYPDVRFVFMTYLNIVYRRGYQDFVADAAKAGAVGVIVPDLPIERAGVLETAAVSRGFANIRLIAPNATDTRIKRLTQDARGLIYAVARAGVTGAKSDFSSVRGFVSRIRSQTDVPVAVGFGVRTPDDVRQLKGIADLAVVGTASLQAFEEGGISGFSAFWQGLAGAAYSKD